MNLCEFCIMQDLEYFENQECEYKEKEIVDKCEYFDSLEDTLK